MDLTEENIIERNDDFLVTESSIKKNISPSELMEFLGGRKTTAYVTTRILQGGTASTVVIEKTKISKKQRDSIREILGMY